MGGLFRCATCSKGAGLIAEYPSMILSGHHVRTICVREFHAGPPYKDLDGVVFSAEARPRMVAVIPTTASTSSEYVWSNHHVRSSNKMPEQRTPYSFVTPPLPLPLPTGVAIVHHEVLYCTTRPFGGTLEAVARDQYCIGLGRPDRSSVPKYIRLSCLQLACMVLR